MLNFCGFACEFMPKQRVFQFACVVKFYNKCPNFAAYFSVFRLARILQSNILDPPKMGKYSLFMVRFAPFRQFFAHPICEVGCVGNVKRKCLRGQGVVFHI